MGAAVRHAARLLAERPRGHRLLLLLTDGKPNDADHYEGRYAVEDTRMAIREARRVAMMNMVAAGMAVVAAGLALWASL